jgi:hypothetical protein
MSLYIILATIEHEGLQTQIESKFSSQFYKITPTQWIVSAEHLTSKEVLTTLGADKGEYGRIVAFSVSGYFGWHQPDMWEWLKTRGA